MSGYLKTSRPTGNIVWITNTWVFTADSRQAEEQTLKFRGIKTIMTTVRLWGSFFGVFSLLQVQNTWEASQPAQTDPESLKTSEKCTNLSCQILCYKPSRGFLSMQVDNANVMKSSRDLCPDLREFHQWQSHFCTHSSWKGTCHNSPRASSVICLCCANCHQGLKQHKDISRKQLTKAEAGRGRILQLVRSCGTGQWVYCTTARYSQLCCGYEIWR